MVANKVAVKEFKGTPGQLRRRRFELTGGLVIGGLIFLWLAVNFVKSPSQFAQVGLLGIRNGLLYALIALGYTMVYGIIQLINFAHGDLFMLGAVFSSYFITVWFNQDKSNPMGWLTFGACLIAAMAFCGTINVLIERFAYRPLRRAPRLAALITAVGMSFLLQFVGLKWNGSTPIQWPTVIPHGQFIVFGVIVNWLMIILLSVTVPILLVLTFVVNKTKQGKAMRATAQDQDAARLMGINVNKTIAFTFAIGGSLAGAAGLLYQQAIGTTNYNLGFQLGLVAFTAAVLGGIGNLNGAVLGALLIGIIQGLNDGLPIGLGQKWSQTLVFTILILILVFKPAGLLGKSAIEKV